MKITNKVIKIKCDTVSLDFIEKYFRSNGLEVIRYAIVGADKNELTLDCAILDKGELPRLVNKFLRNIF